MNSPYKDTVEKKMVDFYQSLPEKDRRRYAAIEALKLPHGGQKYICDLLNCDPKTVEVGLRDLLDPEELKKKK
jgi:hypothetical protein